jgi:hypothetical protein
MGRQLRSPRRMVRGSLSSPAGPGPERPRWLSPAVLALAVPVALTWVPVATLTVAAPEARSRRVASASKRRTMARISIQTVNDI